ncbi:MAG: hypothetical protein QMD06_02965 [Candidatus Altarchaeum sp.]|nr:hypothetical protein [Candidatus Altarchaeum sp.]
MRSADILSLIAFGIFVVFVLVVLFADVGLDTGTGKQVGHIAEIEETGILWKPADMRLLNIITTMSEKDTSWHYGIEPDQKEKASMFQRANTPVEVRYEVRMLTWKWEYSHRVVIVGIEQLNKTNNI